MAVSLVYETHARTEDNETGIATGWLPGRLSAFGRDAARVLGERRRDVDAVFTSDLGRAVETATLAFTDRPVPVYFDSRLRECDYGTLNGAPVAELDPQRRRRIDEPFPGGQSYRQVVEATGTFLEDLVAGWDGRRVVVVAHSANRWALQHLLTGTPLEDLVDAPFAWREGWEFTVPTGWTVSGTRTTAPAARPGPPPAAGPPRRAGSPPR